MGWSRGSEIFEPVAREVVREVDNGNVGERQGSSILATLARALVDGDWDTGDEAAEEFAGHWWVVTALRDAGAIGSDSTE